MKEREEAFNAGLLGKDDKCENSHSFYRCCGLAEDVLGLPHQRLDQGLVPCRFVLREALLVNTGW